VMSTDLTLSNLTGKKLRLCKIFQVWGSKRR
jgi:hypothetical protein